MSEYIPINLLMIYSKLLSHRVGYYVFVNLIGNSVIIRIRANDQDKITDLATILNIEYISKVNYNNDLFVRFNNSLEFEKNIIKEVQTYKILE